MRDILHAVLIVAFLVVAGLAGYVGARTFAFNEDPREAIAALGNQIRARMTGAPSSQADTPSREGAAGT